MQIAPITQQEAQAECSDDEWQQMQSQMQVGDVLVRYSNVDVYLGFCSGEEGIALLRDGVFVAKSVTVIVG